jgi:glucokinase
MSELVVGVDVGGTKSAVGVVRRDGRILLSRRRPAGVERGPSAMIEDYVEMARDLLAEAQVPGSRLLGVGVGCGGPLDPETGVIFHSANLPGWENVPLAALLKGALSLPTWVDNDANAAALAEYWVGAGRECDPMVYLTISTGIGGGVIIGGELYRGASGNAGELGHMIVQTGDRSCGCGGRGCLEAYCSGTSIAARAVEALGRDGSGSALAMLGRPPRAEDVVTLAAEGDALATRLWNETLDYLAAGVVNVIHVFEPRCIVIGGGVTRAGRQLFDPLEERVRALAMPRLVANVCILPAALGDDVGILGAAAVALSRSDPRWPAGS